MKRDTLFYRIFKEFPELLFQLTGDPPLNAAGYRFNSVAVKEPTFTIDGVFEPPVLDGTGTMYLAEVQIIYLNEFGNIRDLPLIVSLAVLPTVPPKKAPAEAKDILARARKQPQRYEAIIDLVTRVMSYMFIDQSPQEIDQMLDIRFEETRVYKDTRAQVTLNMVLSQLEENCGQLTIELIREVNALPINRLEALGKALLKFQEVEDLEKWLQENAAEG